MKFYGNDTKNTIATGTAFPARQDSVTITGHWDKHAGEGLGGGFFLIYIHLQSLTSLRRRAWHFQVKKYRGTNARSLLWWPISNLNALLATPKSCCKGKDEHEKRFQLT